jgi:nucleotide-binding universal stress UspA family protein
VTSTLIDTAAGAGDHSSAAGGHPVLLATLDAPLLANAAHVAIDAAVESGQPLLVVNAVEVTVTRATLALGYDYITPPQIESSLQAPAALATSLGVHVERIRLRSPHPIDALLEFTGEREVGLLVLGADPDAMRGRRYRKSVRKILEHAPCLVWVA